MSYIERQIYQNLASVLHLSGRLYLVRWTYTLAKQGCYARNKGERQSDLALTTHRFESEDWSRTKAYHPIARIVSFRSKFANQSLHSQRCWLIKTLAIQIIERSTANSTRHSDLDPGA
jgi:hypothetical protein